MEKQNVIKWLKEQLIEHLKDHEVQFGTLIQIKKTFDKAEDIFQEQIEEAYWDGGQDVPVHGNQCKIYFNKNYGNILS